jgi:hypothetical protein
LIFGMSPGEIVGVAACCVVASATQSLSSFGFAIVMVAVLPLLGVSIQDSAVLVTLLVVPNLAIAVWRLRREVSLRRIRWMLLGVPVGIPVGLYLLTGGPEWLLRGLLGVVLVFAAVEPLLRGSGGARPERRRWAFLAGAASGALGAALSTGGPPIVMYFHRRQWSKELTKACVMLMFVGTVSMRLISYFAQIPFTGKELVTRDVVLKAALLSPAVVGGTLVGEWLFGWISQSGFRRVVAAMLAGCGLHQLARAAGVW